MVASIHDLKVLWIVVPRIAVDVVDDFFRPKSATERILRDEAMFGHLPTTDREVAVALVDPAPSVATLRVMASDVPVRLFGTPAPRIAATAAFAKIWTLHTFFARVWMTFLVRQATPHIKVAPTKNRIDRRVNHDSYGVVEKWEIRIGKVAESFSVGIINISSAGSIPDAGFTPRQARFVGCDLPPKY